MTNLKLLTAGFAALVFAGCSQMTVLRTQEMKAVGAEVEQRMDSVAIQLQAQNDSLRAELEAASLAQKRMQAEITILGNIFL